MTKISYLEATFVELMPKPLEAGKLYISVRYKTTVHLCACGCGNKVVLPLGPAEWAFTYDGQSVSMNHSVGNWEYPCRSHYWIRKGQIKWAGPWDQERVEAGRLRDQRELDGFIASRRKEPRLLSAAVTERRSPDAQRSLGDSLRRIRDRVRRAHD